MKRSPILPIDTPDRPRSPATIEPLRIQTTPIVDSRLRARVWRAILAALCLFWLTVAIVLTGASPW